MPHQLLDERLIGAFIRDLGALMHASTVLVGDRLGLYRAMADCRWLSPAELADRTDTNTQVRRRWLAAQAASGYADYDPHTGRFRLSEEQAFVLTSEFNPMFFPGGIQAAASMIKDVDLIVDAFRDGRGVAWGSTTPDLFAGTERFFGRTTSRTSPTTGSQRWMGWKRSCAPVPRWPTSVVATARQRSFWRRRTPDLRSSGMTSIGRRSRPPGRGPAEAGVADRCRFEVAEAADYPGRVSTWWRCLTVSTTWVTRWGGRAHSETLAEDGTCLLVEPYAEDRLEDNDSGRTDLLRGINDGVHAEFQVTGRRTGARRPGR